MTKLLACFISSFILALPVSAEQLPAPSGEPILWVSGNIAHSNSDKGVELDQAMVDKLTNHTVSTNNHVVSKVADYQGPKLESVLSLVGARGSDVKIVAWDDYVVTIPIETIKKYGVLLATHENGVRMTLDDKGPFFVVFPFSQYAELRNDLYYNLSVWQVRDIIVK
ncbi:hypothetical protein L4C34_01490 [Vibrio profundum]|uniref:hypothetical protein n=1 Tax=Vibrio profundum TaxID=2910247 RepID=UPI003D10B7DD